MQRQSRTIAGGDFTFEERLVLSNLAVETDELLCECCGHM